MSAIKIFFFIVANGWALNEEFLGDKKLRYQTSFGGCPSRTAGALTLKLVKAFEKNWSLKDVKKKIVDEKLVAGHFISKYRIDYNPIKKFLKLNFDCPTPLMKVQIYREDGVNSYDAILVASGELYDPTYETLLRSEQKLTDSLPFLALPVGELEQSVQRGVTNLVREMGSRFRKKLAEVIFNEKGELTIILSIKGHPSSVFLGEKGWGGKVEKLKRIIKYMEERNRIPTIINLTNSKKVVVKFNNKS